VIGRVSHDPRWLKDELSRTAAPVVIDTETTGVARHSRLLSVGCRIDGVNHILFARRCPSATIRPFRLADDELRAALRPLAERTDLILVGYNLGFDVRMLQAEGVPFVGEWRDCLALLRLLDQDRAESPRDDEGDDRGDRGTRARLDLAAPGGPRPENYRLKDVAAQLCGIRPLYTPSKKMATAPYATHATYLAHDLFATERLHEWLWSRLGPEQRRYARRVLAPLLRRLARMAEAGVAADGRFIEGEAGRLRGLAARIAAAHRTRHGADPSELGDGGLRDLLYEVHRLPVLKGPKWRGSIDAGTLRRLAEVADGPLRGSLTLIAGYRLAKDLAARLASYGRHIDEGSGRIHSQFAFKQSSGRISSTTPNLQQLANTKEILPGTEFATAVRTRNAIVAPPGHVLVAADIEQADVRALAHAIASCRVDTATHRANLLALREARLGHLLAPYRVERLCLDPDFAGQPAPAPPPFDPHAPSRLVADFRDGRGDFYCTVAGNIAGDAIGPDDPRRKIYKSTLLGVINGMTAAGLRKQLRCGRSDAERFVAEFFRAYPDVEGYLALLKLQVALTGRTSTWAGRVRTVAAHRWMVAEPRVRVLLTYADGNRYWFDIVPLTPTLRFLTGYVLRIWSVSDPERPKKIYDHRRGRIGTRFYKQIDEPLLYTLPIRNIPWSNVRQVQRLDSAGGPVEQARYEGLDATARSAINAVMQGGTADLAFRMMLRTRHLERHFGARLVLQVHDELVWECPGADAAPFLRALKDALERPPARDSPCRSACRSRRGAGSAR
jgi:DNA polymerase I-like protein with 3'-5' exonuclease and polymerase domains